MDSFDLRLVLHAEGDLVLSRPTEADVDQLVEACRDLEIVRFTQVPSPYTPAHAREHVTLSLQRAQSGTALNLLGRDANGRVLGSFGMPRVSRAIRAGEIGYWVAPWARRQGVATRATRAVCRWAFTEGGFERLSLEAATIAQTRSPTVNPRPADTPSAGPASATTPATSRPSTSSAPDGGG